MLTFSHLQTSPSWCWVTRPVLTSRAHSLTLSRPSASGTGRRGAPTTLQRWWTAPMSVDTTGRTASGETDNSLFSADLMKNKLVESEYGFWKINPPSLRLLQFQQRNWPFCAFSRCFVYKQIHNGYQLSQSAEAKCNLYTAAEGYRTMTLTKCKWNKGISCQQVAFNLKLSGKFLQNFWLEDIPKHWKLISEMDCWNIYHSCPTFINSWCYCSARGWQHMSVSKLVHRAQALSLPGRQGQLLSQSGGQCYNYPGGNLHQRWMYKLN